MAEVAELSAHLAPTAGKVNADPLYLNTLASLGQTVRSKVMATPAKDSIAVLPFTNISGEPAQEFFTDGLTEDIITDLSNAPGLFVIARNSTLAYKGKPTDVRQIAHDLGVKYILEGSARRSETRLRINVQLSSAAEGGQHVWAERFDRQLTDVFAVQDEIARRVVDAICGKLVGAVSFRSATAHQTLRHMTSACDRGTSGMSLRQLMTSHVRFLNAPSLLDPDYCEAHWQLANALIFSWQLWGDAQEPNHRNALALARRAVEIDPGDSAARCTFRLHVAL